MAAHRSYLRAWARRDGRGDAFGSAGSLQAGIDQVSEGTAQLVSGIELLKTSVDDSALELSGGSETLQGLGAFAAQP